VIGEADEAEPALPGMELDDDQIRSRKVAEQVSELIRSNPNDAASLLRRWAANEDA
jgi:flagellar biosynthesis/type III secretory pathway M-ring protein FliF/YscJ